MSKKLYEESNIQDIASAIRAKNGTQNTYTVNQMGNAIRNIHVQAVMQTKEITPSGSSQIVEPDSGYDGLASVTINGDTNLVPSNIKNGVRIFGVDGNYEGSGGTASFDNILVGSSIPDASIGTPGDVYIQALTNRVDGRAYHKIITLFYKTSQNVWAKLPDPALPYPRASLRIVTHSTSGSDASIDIYVNQTFIRNILYGTVSSTSAHSFDDLFNLFVGYGISSAVAPDGISRNGWCIYAPNNGSAIYNGESIGPNSLIRKWTYDTSVDFTIEV